jgi:hypothetical protein
MENGRVTPLGCSGRTALRREKCNGFAQSVAKQRLGKQTSTDNVFYGVRAATVATQRRGKHISAAVSRHATIGIT